MLVKCLHIERNKIDDFMWRNLYGFCNIIEVEVLLTSILAQFFIPSFY